MSFFGVLLYYWSGTHLIKIYEFIIHIFYALIWNTIIRSGDKIAHLLSNYCMLLISDRWLNHETHLFHKHSNNYITIVIAIFVQKLDFFKMSTVTRYTDVSGSFIIAMPEDGHFTALGLELCKWYLDDNKCFHMWQLMNACTGLIRFWFIYIYLHRVTVACSGLCIVKI